MSQTQQKFKLGYCRHGNENGDPELVNKREVNQNKDVCPICEFREQEKLRQNSLVDVGA